MIDNVVIYTVAKCQYCVEAKEYLVEHGIEFREVNLSEGKNRKARQRYRSMGFTKAPIIFFNFNDDEYVFGEFDKDKLDKFMECKDGK
jgi:glutaredoxin